VNLVLGNTATVHLYEVYERNVRREESEGEEITAMKMQDAR
jgi:hypothetical protein